MQPNVPWSLFRLSDEFVEPFKKRDVDWGPLGYLVYKRTYSVEKPDGSSEEWWETCRRNVEGTFSILKGHIESNDIDWPEELMRTRAEEMYRRQFEFKFVPPGRGISKMGHDVVREIGGACLNNPLRGDELLYTSEGLARIGELSDGTKVHVWTGAGWREGTSKSYGVQPVNKITMKPECVAGSRTEYRVVKHATPAHGWYLANGDWTHDLRVGHVVDSSAPVLDTVDEEGLRHGYMFADGSCTYLGGNGYLHQMRLCGDKSRVAHLFDRVTYNESSGDDPWARHNSSQNYKVLPSDDKPLAYHASFVRAWVDFDGCKGKGSRIRLDTISEGAQEYLEKWAPVAGWGIVGLSEDKRDTNYGPRSAPLKRFFLAPINEITFKVVSIEQVGEEEVFCLHVPGEHEFALSSGVRSLNCGFVSTAGIDEDFSGPFTWLMEMSMYGVGVGFDTEGAGKITLLTERAPAAEAHVVGDSREGWAEYLRLLLESMVRSDVPRPVPDYSLVRPRGAPLKRFGGTASGPEALVLLTERLDALYELYRGKVVDSRFIVDVCNSIGECVVSGGVRRTAELALGSERDEAFLNLKNFDLKDAITWPRWASNNSLVMDATSDFEAVGDMVARGVEIGCLFLDNCRKYGRMGFKPDFKDLEAVGTNPCGEQTLHHKELCTLVETFPSRHESIHDYFETLECAYLYAKIVTLIPTHSPETNAVLARNRRLGISQTGIMDAVEKLGKKSYSEWCSFGYGRLRLLDVQTSESWGVPKSIKLTSVKPSGTVSKLAGVREGIHESKGRYEYRTVRMTADSPLLAELARTNHRIVQDPLVPNTKIVYFAQAFPNRRETDPTVEEQFEMAALLQHNWCDNQVSITIDFDPETEGHKLGPLMREYYPKLKGLSFLARNHTQYEHAPIQVITKEEYEAYMASVQKPDFSRVGYGRDMEEKFCDGVACEVAL